MILINARRTAASIVASLTIFGLGTSGLVQATEIVAVPQRPSSGPVFAPLRSASSVSANTLQSQVAHFWSDTRLSKNVSALVVDASTGAVLLDRNSDVGMTPASTIKLVTAAAAIEELGATTRFTTKVTRAGNVFTLVGGGDPTLTSRLSSKWRGKPAGVERPRSLDELAALTAAAIGPQSSEVIVNVDTSYFSGRPVAASWRSSYVASGFVAPVTGLTVDFGVAKNGQPLSDPAQFAGKYFVAALKSRGIVAKFGKKSTSAADATLVAQVESATVIDVVERMLTTSNNTIAEYLAHHVGRASGDSSFDGSARAVIESVSSLGIETKNLKLYDGSGLSKQDRASAQTLVDTLFLAQHDQPQLWPILSGLPIAGVSGTLSHRYPRHAQGRGYVQAKTGTLSGVVSLAGTVVDKGGNLMIFALMANKVADDYSAEVALDSLVQAFAECGCR